MLYTRQTRNTIPCLSISLALIKPGINADFFSQEMERYFSFKSNHLNSAIQNNDQTLTFFPHFLLRAYIVHTFSPEGMQKRDISRSLISQHPGLLHKLNFLDLVSLSIRYQSAGKSYLNINLLVKTPFYTCGLKVAHSE